MGLWRCLGRLVFWAPMVLVAVLVSGCNQIDEVRLGNASERDPGPQLLARALDGEVRAQVAVARFYKKNAAAETERSHNETEALRWFTLAAEQEDADAQMELGLMLVTAEGSNRNVQEARRWLSRAGQAGKAPAYFMLGEVSRDGEGGAPNPVMAVAFWNKAADLGHTRRTSPVR
jgi:TPR repeat protein